MIEDVNQNQEEVLEVEETPIESAEVTTEENPIEENSQEKPQKEDKTDWEKRHKDAEKVIGRQGSELAEYRRKMQQVESYFARQEQEKRNAELKAKHPDLPLDVLNRLVDERTNEVIEPIRQKQFEEQQIKTAENIYTYITEQVEPEEFMSLVNQNNPQLLLLKPTGKSSYRICEGLERIRRETHFLEL